MNKLIFTQRTLISIGIPILMMVILVCLATSDGFWTNPTQLSFGITFDFLVTIPFVYFLLIRKTKIPQKTTYLFILGGLAVASLAIPLEYQRYLSFVIQWLLPIIEGTIVLFVLVRLVKGVLIFRKTTDSFDFFTTLKSTCQQILPKKVANLFATEIAVIYYGFIHWKKEPVKAGAFTYHKRSGITTVLLSMLFLIVIETFVIHILLALWNETIAWIITAMSIYTLIQIWGFQRSLSKRFITIENDVLHLRYGILCEAFIELKNIESIELSSASIPKNSPIKIFSPFGGLEPHNMVITLKEENSMARPYGFRAKFKTLALFVDNKKDFKNKIENAT